MVEVFLESLDRKFYTFYAVVTVNHVVENNDMKVTLESQHSNNYRGLVYT